MWTKIRNLDKICDFGQIKNVILDNIFLGHLMICILVLGT